MFWQKTKTYDAVSIVIFERSLQFVVRDYLRGAPDLDVSCDYTQKCIYIRILQEGDGRVEFEIMTTSEEPTVERIIYHGPYLIYRCCQRQF